MILKVLTDNKWDYNKYNYIICKLDYGRIGDKPWGKSARIGDKLENSEPILVTK